MTRREREGCQNLLNISRALHASRHNNVQTMYYVLISITSNCLCIIECYPSPAGTSI